MQESYLGVHEMFRGVVANNSRQIQELTDYVHTTRFFGDSKSRARATLIRLSGSFESPKKIHATGGFYSPVEAGMGKVRSMLRQRGWKNQVNSYLRKVDNGFKPSVSMLVAYQSLQCAKNSTFLLPAEKYNQAEKLIKEIQGWPRGLLNILQSSDYDLPKRRFILDWVSQFQQTLEPVLLVRRRSFNVSNWKTEGCKK